MHKFLKKNWPLFCVALLVLIVCFYLGRSRREIVRSPILPGPVTEGAKLEDIHFTHESPTGTMKWTLDAKEVKVSGDRQQISFTDFSFRLEPQNRPAIHVEGKNGHYDKSIEQLLLSGDLHGRTEDGYAIATEKAVYDQKEGKLTTDETVLITGPFLSIEGQGLTYDVEAQTLEIKSKTKTLISRGPWVS